MYEVSTTIDGPQKGDLITLPNDVVVVLQSRFSDTWNALVIESDNPRWVKGMLVALPESLIEQGELSAALRMSYASAILKEMDYI